MLWLAFTAAAATAGPIRFAPEPVTVQATATVRVISGVRLKLDSVTNRDAPAAHRTEITSDGVRRPARLIEFE